MGRLRLSSIPALVVGLVCLWVLAGIAWSLRIVPLLTILLLVAVGRAGAMTAAGRRSAAGWSSPQRTSRSFDPRDQRRPLG